MRQATELECPFLYFIRVYFRLCTPTFYFFAFNWKVIQVDDSGLLTYSILRIDRKNGFNV